MASCGGFFCTKNALIALNILFIVISILLIVVAVYSRAHAIVPNINVIGGIFGCGVFLFFLSLMGLIGARNHNQVMLFFYMITLFLLFVAQFAIACACLAIADDQQWNIAEQGWISSSNSSRLEAEKYFHCCGFSNQTTSSADIDACSKVVDCCPTKFGDCQCGRCGYKIKDAISSGLTISGGVGAFFALTEFCGVWLTIRYRNLRDPRADPSAFL